MSSQVKFGRNYLLTVTGPNFAIPLVLGLPFTLEFDINRSNYADTNYAKISIYNLSVQHRNLLLHDQFDWSKDHILNVTLQAGYGPGPQYPIIFQGNVTKSWSVRQGVDFITTMECFDGGNAFANAFSNVTFNTGESMQVVYDTLIKDLAPYGISKGAVSQKITAGTLAKGTSYSGSTIDILREISNSNFFIDNLKANILSSDDAIGGNRVVINAASGLLGTPVKEQTYLNFDILFEPRLIIGSTVNLQSTTGVGSYNGIHKIVSIHHRGIISPVVAGDAVTSLGVAAGIFNEITAKVGL